MTRCARANFIELAPSFGESPEATKMKSIAYSILMEQGGSMFVRDFFNDMESLGYRNKDVNNIVLGDTQFEVKENKIQFVGDKKMSSEKKQKNALFSAHIGGEGIGDQDKLKVLLRFFHDYPKETHSENAILGILENPHGIDNETRARGNPRRVSHARQHSLVSQLPLNTPRRSTGS